VGDRTYTKKGENRLINVTRVIINCAVSVAGGGT